MGVEGGKGRKKVWEKARAVHASSVKVLLGGRQCVVVGQARGGVVVVWQGKGVGGVVGKGGVGGRIQAGCHHTSPTRR